MQPFSRAVAYLNVLLPTATGVVVYVVCSGSTLLIHQIPSVQHYLNVPSSLHIGSSLLNLLSNFLLKLFGASQLDTIVLSVFWMVVGLAVYVFIKFIVNFCIDVARDLNENKHYIKPREESGQTNVQRLIGQTLFRLVMLGITIVYAIWTVGFFLHGSIPSDTAFGHWVNAYPAMRQAALFLGECLALYGLTILLRLVVLRARLSL